ALAGRGIIAPYLHLPAQSGSDRVLYRMKRRYNRDRYLEIVERVRRALPDIALSSDFIVGFPGETEEDFEQTLDLVRAVRFASLFAFRYSPRPGTASARWGRENAVPETLAAERLARLFELQETLQTENHRELEGRLFEVLIEGKDRKGQSRGRTPCNRIVHIPEDPRGLATGSYVRVRIIRGLPNSLIGELAA
ncbi:MAG TPA: radical SAM protein, partial [Thermoanaerobaculia bacterium]|nr:radical SAM protein [Thermoanaerobaculia bacterium]